MDDLLAPHTLHIAYRLLCPCDSLWGMGIVVSRLCEELVDHPSILSGQRKGPYKEPDIKDFGTAQVAKKDASLDLLHFCS